MVTPERHFFTERRMKERSGWGHTRDDFFDRNGCSCTTEDFFHRETVEGEKWMGSHHRRFFSQRQLMERSGCGRTTEDFFTENQLTERNGCGCTTEDFFTVDGEKWM